MATVLHPGRLSPVRQVPAEITRPEYVGKKRPKTGEPDVKTPEIVARMRVAGKLAAQALEAVGAAVAPGVTTDHLDQVGHDYLVSRGISADRLNTVSYGEERPKYDNSREETRRLNRRAALVARIQ